MTSQANTVEEYLQEVPEDRLPLVTVIRDTINANLPAGYEEGMQYGMIGWFVPHSAYPPGYHCDPKQPLPFASLANQKGHVGIYLFCTYMEEADRERFREAWLATGCKLDMGKSCVRVKKLDQVPLDVLGSTIAEIPMADYVARYDAAFGPDARKKKKR